VSEPMRRSLPEVFLQITSDDEVSLAIPGHRYTFGIFQEAEARSDLDVLAARGQRVPRLHLGTDVPLDWSVCAPPCRDER
jgi:hypothetical protein